MNLAWRDVRHQGPRFALTGLGLGLLFTVVLAMAGIYRGLIEDATLLVDRMDADLWLVQRDTRGPFAERSVVSGEQEDRARLVLGVASARSFTFATIQRQHDGKALRLSLIGLAWPADRGRDLPIIAGRALEAAHREMIADRSLGLPLGARVRLAAETYTVVGLTRGLLSSGGEGVAALSERDDRAELPALPLPSPSAVLVRLRPGVDAASVRARLLSWPDASVFSAQEQRDLLLGGVVEKSRQQLRLFRALLTVVSTIIVALILYNMTVAKTREIALLKLIGARTGAALDSKRGGDVMHLFKRIARDHGAAVVVVTHDHRTLDAFDAIYEMEDGALRPARAAAVA